MKPNYSTRLYDSTGLDNSNHDVNRNCNAKIIPNSYISDNHMSNNHILDDNLPNLLSQYHQYKSEQHAIMNVINCYLREFAIPNQDMSIDESHNDLPLCLLYNRACPNERLLTIRFPTANDSSDSARIVLPVAYFSHLGKCQLSGSPWLKTDHQPWMCLNIYQLINYTHDYIAARYQLNINQELKDQIINSIGVTTAFLHSPTHNCCGIQSDKSSHPHNDYIYSEQALLWGHAYHPSPKSRQGVNMTSLLTHSPETQSQFSLFWFKIDPSLVTYIGEHAKTVLSDIAHTLLSESADSLNPISQDDWVYYPCHPWEAAGILANLTIKRAMASGYVVPVGIAGKTVSPTSSVRTLYHDQLSHFIKCSIHVRLTNCIRKNAWYELHSAVYLNSILEKIYHSKRLTDPTFKLMLEPAAATVDMASKFPDEDAESIQFITEAFGVLFRESFTADEIKYLTPQVAAALFTEDRFGDSVIERQLQQRHSQTVQIKGEIPPYDSLACLWLDRYAHILINGAFDYFFNHGIVFEPHLQNTVIGFNQGLPSCVWIRDLEGTKLVDTLWSLDKATGLSARSKQSILYSKDEGWSRIAYCVFVNNLSEAIFYLCRGSSSAEALESLLWQSIKNILINWQLVYGVQPEIQALIEGGSMPSKTNYKTRLLKLADKCSAYVMIPCPWKPSALNPNKGSNHGSSTHSLTTHNSSESDSKECLK